MEPFLLMMTGPAQIIIIVALRHASLRVALIGRAIILFPVISWIFKNAQLLRYSTVLAVFFLHERVLCLFLRYYWVDVFFLVDSRIKWLVIWIILHSLIILARCIMGWKVISLNMRSPWRWMHCSVWFLFIFLFFINSSNVKTAISICRILTVKI